MRRGDFPGSPNGLSYGAEMHIIDAETGRMRKPGMWKTWSGFALAAILVVLIGAPWFIGLYTIMEWAISR